MHSRSNRHPSVGILALGFVLSALVAGCGGSDDNDSGSGTNSGTNSGSGSGNATTVRTGVDITWSGRSRAFVGPSSALSARVTFVGASATGTDVATVVDRRSNPDAYTTTYPLSAPVRTGVAVIRVEYFAAASAGGSRVGIAETGAIVKPDGTISRADGTAISFVNAESDIASLAIVAPATLRAGETATLGFTARANNGAVIALSPGSVTFSASGAVTTTPDGTLTASRTGTGEIRAQLDGLSATATVTVTAANSAAVVTIDQPANEIAFSLRRTRIVATTPSTGSNPNRLIEIDPVSGSIGNAYQVGSSPGPVALSGDGSVAYVGVTGAASLLRIDLTTGSVGAPVTFGTNADGSFAVLDAVVSPSDPNTVGVSLSSDNFQVQTAIVRNGTVAPNRTNGFYENYVVAFNVAGTELYGYDSYTSGMRLSRNTVDANGVTATTQGANVLDGSDLNVAGDRIFGRDGRVVNASTFAAAGRFDLGSNRATGSAIDPATGRAYFVVPSSSGSVQLLTFNTETYELISTQTLPISVNDNGRFPVTRRLVVTGTNRLAYSSGTQIFLIDTTKL